MAAPGPRSKRPYLIRAVYEWLADGNYTPHIIVAADYPGVVVPRQFVRNGRIILNISMAAAKDLRLDDPVWFSARFGGKAQDVVIPAAAIVAMYASEDDGVGHLFIEPELAAPEQHDDAEAEEGTDAPVLDAADANADGERADIAAPAVAPDAASPDSDPPVPDKPAPRPGGRPHLRVVK